MSELKETSPGQKLLESQNSLSRQSDALSPLLENSQNISSHPSTTLVLRSQFSMFHRCSSHHLPHASEDSWTTRVRLIACIMLGIQILISPLI